MGQSALLLSLGREGWMPPDHSTLALCLCLCFSVFLSLSFPPSLPLLVNLRVL